MIAIIDYNAGNTQSVVNALNKLQANCIVTNNHEEILKADKVIFPGVGAAGAAMEQLSNSGLKDLIPTLQQPLLGICLGLQLLCKHSEEDDVACLGVFDVVVKKFPPLDIIPHMGWNNIVMQNSAGLGSNQDFYFVHSYYAPVNPFTTAVCEYIVPFSAALKKDNFYAVQFHPEKSAQAGNDLIAQFLQL